MESWEKFLQETTPKQHRSVSSVSPGIAARALSSNIYSGDTCHTHTREPSKWQLSSPTERSSDSESEDEEGYCDSPTANPIYTDRLISGPIYVKDSGSPRKGKPLELPDLPEETEERMEIDVSVSFSTPSSPAVSGSSPKQRRSLSDGITGAALFGSIGSGLGLPKAGMPGSAAIAQFRSSRMQHNGRTEIGQSVSFAERPHIPLQLPPEFPNDAPIQIQATYDSDESFIAALRALSDRFPAPPHHQPLTARHRKARGRLASATAARAMQTAESFNDSNMNPPPSPGSSSINSTVDSARRLSLGGSGGWLGFRGGGEKAQKIANSPPRAMKRSDSVSEIASDAAADVLKRFGGGRVGVTPGDTKSLSPGIGRRRTPSIGSGIF